MIQTWKKSSKSVRLQVLVSPEDYAAWYTYAAENEITVKNDSDLVRKLIARVQNIDKLDLDVYILKDRCTRVETKLKERDIIIEKQRESISILKSKRLQLIEELDRLNENIKIKRSKKKIVKK